MKNNNDFYKSKPEQKKYEYSEVYVSKENKFDRKGQGVKKDWNNKPYRESNYQKGVREVEVEMMDSGAQKSKWERANSGNRQKNTNEEMTVKPNEKSTFDKSAKKTEEQSQIKFKEKTPAKQSDKVYSTNTTNLNNVQVQYYPYPLNYQMSSNMMQPGQFTPNLATGQQLNTGSKPTDLYQSNMNVGYNPSMTTGFQPGMTLGFNPTLYFKDMPGQTGFAYVPNYYGPDAQMAYNTQQFANMSFGQTKDDKNNIYVPTMPGMYMPQGYAAGYYYGATTNQFQKK